MDRLRGNLAARSALCSNTSPPSRRLPRRLPGALRHEFGNHAGANMSYDQERRARALETYKKMGWGENEVVKEIDMELWKMITDVMFGEVWSRPGLSLRDRQLITLGVLVADRAEGMK